MAVVTKSSLAFLLIFALVQVSSSTRRTKFVYGPRQHLDSGQIHPEPHLAASTQVTDERDKEFDYFYDDYQDNEVFPPTYYDMIEEEEEEEEEIWPEDEGELERVDDQAWYEPNEGNFVQSGNESEFGEDVLVPILIPKRVKRRIIPVGGPIDRRRGDHNPYGRSRSPWAQPPQQNRNPIIRRTGPTGSAALFSLYPELAPPEWKARRGIKSSPKKKSNSRERDTEAIEKRAGEEHEAKTNNRTENSDATNSKRKAKLSKRTKKEIAIFAERHGIDKAVTHFKSRVDGVLRASRVEKFLRRYQNRLRRRANRMRSHA